MSRLGQQLTLIQLSPEQRRPAEVEPMLFLSVEREIVPILSTLETKYSLTATAHADLWLSPQADRQDATRKAKRCILGEVFGEFHAPLSQAIYHCGNGERRQAIELIEKVIKDMFDVQ